MKKSKNSPWNNTKPVVGKKKVKIKIIMHLYQLAVIL